MNADVAPEPLGPDIELLILTVLGKRVAEHVRMAKAVAGADLEDGAKRTVRAPDGSKLGSIYRTDPDPEWRVVDPEALDRHLRQDPECLEYVDEIAGTHEQVLEVLREHAPELLARVERVRVDAIAREVAEARAGLEPAPGIARVKPAGVLSVRPDKGAAAVVERLVQAGVVSWDGRPALPAGEQAEAVSA